MADEEREPVDQSENGPQIVDWVSESPETTIGLLGHFYRGEVERMTAWRTRLDQTTNWAVVLMAAILTFAFASSDNPHYVLLIGALGVGSFLVIESQRYQEYDAWRYRVRLVQRNLLACALTPTESNVDDDWRQRLGSDLRRPELVYPWWRAFAHRLKRVYFFLLSVLLVSWVLRISVFAPEESWQRTATIAEIPGTVVVALVIGAYVLLGGLATWSVLKGRAREFGESPVREE